MKKAFLCLSILFLFCAGFCTAQSWNPSHKIGTSTGVYNFSYNQTPDQLVEIFPAGIPNTGLSYQWEKSNTLLEADFTAISGATSSSYTFSGPLSTTTYYRRKTTNTLSQFIYSNTVKISVVSVNWEDINYVREHDVLTTAITSWTSVDQLSIGQKLQTTSYLDGLGRSTEKVSRQTATPATQNGTWGDLVQYFEYDPYGRETKKYLPYSTTTQSGKYKTTASTEQPQYYTSTYNETSAFSTIAFDNSPLNRVTNVKQPGTSWAAGSGNTAGYDLNTTTDDVKWFEADYVIGNAPIYKGTYPANTLYKLTYADENGKQVIEYTSKSGQLILKKVQLDNSPLDAYNGWICTYNIYDDFGLLRFQIQPEGVKYLSNNSWSFAGTNGNTILNEQCFQYFYDEKGRTTWKKAPGAQPLQMMYDDRDRVVFMQDGNQKVLPTAQWTANLYDELDRSVIGTLYNTTRSTATLQSDINNAGTTSTVTITNPGQAVVSLTLNQRQAGISSYTATTSIDFVSDDNGYFDAAAGDVFTAEIDPGAMTAQVSVTNTVHQNPISSTDLNSSSVCTILKYQFYDTYSFNAARGFDNNFTNTTAYSTSDPNVQVIAKSNRTTSMQTGSMTRVLGTTAFLSATHYYDERGALIQTLEDNIKQGTDITTVQYHFDGRVLSTCNEHTTPGTDYTHYKTLTKYLFDNIGRVSSIQKKFGSNGFKTISTYDYDDVGRVKTKHLDPTYTAGGNSELESLTFSYNIHNQITGINKDYALKNPVNYNKWAHFFGLYLGYDNRDNVFTAANLTGEVTGQLWSTQGDDAQRKYDYTYDNAGRLTEAIFKDKLHTTDSWTNAKLDFSVNGTSGKITYDLNGNLLSMLHKGVVPGTTSPITIDSLSYTYASYSNKLQSVTDNMTSTSVNGIFADFKDGTNGTSPDYVYDNNGNVVMDLNKNAKDLNNVSGANGIKYNYLDKPEQIRIAGKGTIKITYSADGEKLQRSFTSETDNTVKTTTYINQFIYEESATTSGSQITPLGLSLMNFEDGRIRVITPTSQNNGLDILTVDGNMDLPGGKRGAYDYFIMDYLQNVRMVLTEEVHFASNTATMELAREVLEESIFGQTGTSNEVEVTRYTKPTAWTGNSSGKVSQVGTNCGHNIGPNVLQKVMAGDKVTATALYYHQGSPGGNNTSFVNTLIGTLTPLISGSSGATNPVKSNATSITTELTNTNGFISAVQPNGSDPTSSTPQAFITILFFDERFNFIESADGGVYQQQVEATVGSDGAPLALENRIAPKNGYVYVYVSNQSNNDVYFDDFRVGITQGNIVEENHYYSYGLKIAAISSRKFADSYEGLVKNNYLYNGKELFDDADLNWYDYGFRNYDPQIGRFTQLDPLTNGYPSLTPYQYASCDPITNIDIDGLEGCSAVRGMCGYVSTIVGGGSAVTKGASSTVKTLSSGIGIINSTGRLIDGTMKQDKISEQANKTFSSRPVSESTNQYSNRNYELLYPEPIPTQIGPGRPSTLGESVSRQLRVQWLKSNGGHDDSYYLNKLRRENIEDVENSPATPFPIIGYLIKSGKYKLKYNYNEEATENLANAGAETLGVILFGALADEVIATKRLTVNPFKGKSFSEIDEMFKVKGFTTKGLDPLNGKGSYYSPSGNRYYFDKGGIYKKGFESPHVDIWYNGHPSFEKVKLFLDGSPKMYTPIK